MARLAARRAPEPVIARVENGFPGQSHQAAGDNSEPERGFDGLVCGWKTAPTLAISNFAAGAFLMQAPGAFRIKKLAGYRERSTAECRKWIFESSGKTRKILELRWIYYLATCGQNGKSNLFLCFRQFPE